MKRVFIIFIVVMIVLSIFEFMISTENERERKHRALQERYWNARKTTDELLAMPFEPKKKNDMPDNYYHMDIKSTERLDHIMLWTGYADKDQLGNYVELRIYPDSTMRVIGDTMGVIKMLLHRIEDAHKK